MPAPDTRLAVDLSGGLIKVVAGALGGPMRCGSGGTPNGSLVSGKVMDVDGVVKEEPAACEPLMWGKQLRGVRVRLRVAAPELVRDLLAAAWRRKAPRTLLKSASS